MKEETERKREMVNHIESNVFNLLEGAVITSSITKVITGYLNRIIEDNHSFTIENQKNFLAWTLSFRRNMANMDYILTQYAPSDVEGTKEIFDTALAKYEAAKAKEEEFEKITSEEFTPEMFLKYLKED